MSGRCDKKKCDCDQFYVRGYPHIGKFLDDDTKKTPICAICKRQATWEQGPPGSETVEQAIKRSEDTTFAWLPKEDIYGTGLTDCFICAKCLDSFQIE